jgi:hypothetical protein
MYNMFMFLFWWLYIKQNLLKENILLIKHITFRNQNSMELWCMYSKCSYRNKIILVRYIQSRISLLVCILQNLSLPKMQHLKMRIFCVKYLEWYRQQKCKNFSSNDNIGNTSIDTSRMQKKIHGVQYLIQIIGTVTMSQGEETELLESS